MFKKNLLLIITLLIALLPLTSCGKDKNEQTGYDGRVFDISDTKEDKVTAKISKTGNNYEITISGTGQAKSYAKKELVPWNAISKRITNVKIEEGVENIGDYYFYSATLQNYYLPSSVLQVEENSFNKSAVLYSYHTSEINNNSENDIYYYSETKPTKYGIYWHMVGDTPTIWKKTKILFIGNSFTYYPTDLYSEANPGVVAITKELANNLGLDLEVDFVVKGAHTLKRFADASDEKGKIVDEKLKASADYDFVILQEQSTTPAESYNSFNQGVTALVKKINDTQNNAKVYLYSTWGFPAGVSDKGTFTSVSTMEGLIRAAYEKCASENDLKVCQVGKAFTYVYENYKDINLYWSDNKHQSFAGAYLSACVHLSTILSVDIRESSYYGILEESVAKTLQNVAHDIVFN